MGETNPVAGIDAFLAFLSETADAVGKTITDMANAAAIWAAEFGQDISTLVDSIVSTLSGPAAAPAVNADAVPLLEADDSVDEIGDIGDIDDIGDIPAFTGVADDDIDLDNLNPYASTLFTDGNLAQNDENQLSDNTNANQNTDSQQIYAKLVEEYRAEHERLSNQRYELCDQINDVYRDGEGLSDSMASLKKDVEDAEAAADEAKEACQDQSGLMPFSKANKELDACLQSLQQSFNDMLPTMRDDLQKRYEKARSEGAAFATQTDGLFGKAQKSLKTLDGQITSGDNAGAMQTCGEVSTILRDFNNAVRFLKQRKGIAKKAQENLPKAMDDNDAMGLNDKAKLIMDLCADKPAMSLSADVIKDLAVVYQKTQPDKSFTDKRAKQCDSIADDVAKIEDVASLFDKTGEIDDAAWAKLVSDKSKLMNVLSQISGVQLKSLGLDSVPVSEIEGVKNAGGYQWHDEQQIKLNFGDKELQKADTAMITILHETFHAQQDKLVEQMMTGDLPESDPQYKQVQMFTANRPGLGYLNYSGLRDKGVPDAYKVYMAQPLEADAEGQAQAAFLAIKKAVKERNEKGQGAPNT